MLAKPTKSFIGFNLVGLILTITYEFCLKDLLT